MSLDAKIEQRFDELISKGKKVLSTRSSYSGVVSIEFVDRDLSYGWITSTLSFISRIFGEDSVHYKKLLDASGQITRVKNAEIALAVIKSAYEDYKYGYLFDTRRKITADVFDEFLEQAEYFLNDGYFQVAAVIAGSVLEDNLRRLCRQNNIPLNSKPKLDFMNSELAKAGMYDKLIQKKITWLADIRNKAAHGRWNEFSHEDVEDMVKAIRRLTEDHH